MKSYIQHHPWKIIESSFKPELNRISESLFSIGNGRMGQRANFEETYSGDHLQGSYIAGVYFPDKTRVGWWKNGYPEYFAKVLNSVNWIGIQISINGQELDLAKAKFYDFERVLDMQHGCLTRTFTVKLPSGEKVKVISQRFLSLKRKDIGCIRYSVEALNFTGELSFMPYLDFDVRNEDSNYEEKFWEEVEKATADHQAYVAAKTKKLDFVVGAAMDFKVFYEGEEQQVATLSSERKKFVAQQFNIHIKEGEQVTLEKYAAVVSTMYYAKEDLKMQAIDQLNESKATGFDALYEEHARAWEDNWEMNDIQIEGDVSAQQGIRFNIFQLYQTYTGDDPRLNIGPKGFTGEKYGGSTYWDTEAYCLPFYMSTTGSEVARNLLVYRYNQLDKAIENAEKLGFENGAALFPMVTMNGEECHNEWEITFEEIHRNGAIAYAIYNYTRYTGDETYLSANGLEVLIAIARFWSQRVQFSLDKDQYVMLGVTGPNEYENNVNNNWYTNYIARWCLQYTLESIAKVKEETPEDWARIENKVNWDEQEAVRWNDIIELMYLPYSKKLGVYLQQDGFLDKELMPVKELDAQHLPINQNWSWDRILRSCFIKQADVLQGLYFFEEHFTEAEILRNFDFYEPMTVHESSLSPCIHAVMAARLGKEEKAYEMYLRTARLDLDDYNNDTEDGCHITSMAGTWLAFVEGFGGKRVKNGSLHLSPMLPKQWTSYSFRILFREAVLNISVNQEQVEVYHLSGPTIPLVVFGQERNLETGSSIQFGLEHRTTVI
jgi:maltose phosphorylase